MTGMCVQDSTAVLITARAGRHCRSPLLHSGEIAVVRHETAVGGRSDTISVYSVFISPRDGLIRPDNCL